MMKKFLLILLALAPMMVSAQVTKDSIFYRCYEEGAYACETDESLSGDIVVPETVTDEDGQVYNVIAIDENAFQWCKISSIILPATLTAIYEDAFTGCSNLKDVTILAMAPPKTNKEAFDDEHFNGVKVHVPTGALDAYKADNYWKQFATIDDNVPVLGDGIAINVTNFPDETFRKFVGGKDIDTDQNGFLSDEEILKVKTIKVGNKGIKSLKGIEYFTELDSLNCARNELTELDVTKNTKLTYLQTRNNQLTTLDVTKNVELKVLRCNSNQLTTLDVTKNTKLTYLGVWVNELTAIDVSKNTELLYLDFSRNNITAIDLSNNTRMLKLGIWGNKLSSLDVSMLPDLTSLYTDLNPLKSLDVTKNTKLDSLSCGNTKLTELDVTKNPRLISLAVWGNQLTKIDVSNNTNLTVLTVSDNQLTSLDVSKNTKLDTLTCYSNQLTELDLSNNTAMTLCFCDNNQLTKLDVTKNTKLKFLDCCYNQLSALDVTKNVELDTLNCGGNQLTELDVTNNTQLIRLYCYGNQLTKLDASKNTALDLLYCQRNQLTSLTLARNGIIKELYCHRNQIRGQAMDDMIASLPNQENGEIALFNTDYIAEEGNVCTTTQVAALKAKGWTAYHLYNDEFVPYPGSDSSAIDGVTLQPEDGSAPAYGLNGQRTSDTHRGVVIRNGKKYIK